jgi:hypothetical protein
MSLRRCCFGVILDVCLLMVVLGCRSPAPTNGTPLSIQITAPNAACLQNQQTGLLTVTAGGGACWTGPDANTPVQVQLPANCPFAQCSFPTTAGSMCSGPANGSVGDYVYTSIMINGKPCTVGTNGLHIKPGP